MGDIRIAWNLPAAYGDWVVATDDLDTSDTLATSVLLSLFTDARAPDDLQIYSADKRGWWGTTYNPSGVAELGSLLWTLERSIKSDGVAILRTAESYCTTALQWLIDTGVASTVTAVASWYSQTNLGIRVSITQPSGAVNNYTWVWSTLS